MNNGNRGEYRSSEPSVIGNKSVHITGIPTDLVDPIDRVDREPYHCTERVVPSLAWPNTATRVPHYKHRHESWVDLFLTLERPHADLLKGTDRGERYRLLMAHAEEQRQRLAHWVEDQGLCDEIVHLGEPNSFHVLFVRCTPEAARRFVRAPGVIDVAICQPD